MSIVRHFIRKVIMEGDQGLSQERNSTLQDKEFSKYLKDVSDLIDNNKRNISMMIDTWYGHKSDIATINELRSLLVLSLDKDLEQHGTETDVIPLSLISICLALQGSTDTAMQSLMSKFENLTNIPVLTTVKSLDNTAEDPDGSILDPAAWYRYARRKSDELEKQVRAQHPEGFAKLDPKVQKAVNKGKRFEDLFAQGTGVYLGFVTTPSPILSAIGKVLGYSEKTFELGCLAIGLMGANAMIFNTFTDIVTDPKINAPDAAKMITLLRNDATNMSASALRYVAAAFEGRQTKAAKTVSKKINDIASSFGNKTLPTRSSLEALRMLLTQPDDMF